MGRKLDQDDDLVMRDADRGTDRSRRTRRQPASDRELGLDPDMDDEKLDLDTLRGGTDRFFLDEEDLGAGSGSDESWSGTARRRGENSRDSRNRR